MFILSEISDLTRIPPHTFNLPVQESLSNELHKKYSNKVISNLGLAVCLWDILEIKDGLLRPGDGGSYVESRFRLVVWKPFVGEILEGTVSDCTIEGIKVKMDFFDEIIIPKNSVFENCFFKPLEKAWVWKPDEETELFIDINEKIRFRVEEEVFISIKPKANENESEPVKTPPYAIIASCQMEGMGCVSWWD